ncbi:MULTISPECIES: type IV pilin protein [Xanthomonas]|uniref:type IV pilin protein n=1 Tax=Xanthomonas TaxID=338 RepID=UPI001C48222D|nr:type IV pilin protein [Xanthomonas euvesicatoria]MBV6845533.1 type IV pilin protein [Xanthomonas campestris pv. paulliniae]MCP3039051.1 type IV pilin protein [Xanthomonas euvesicatoria pv. allii]MCP3051180.1 type IV pilin protein [Xanthomonas euvesicatoria pv. allii]
MSKNTKLAPTRVRWARGFTLIELMIVVAVIAILAAVAYPSYQEQVRKARRGQAKADLVEYAQLAERFRTVNNTYVGYAMPASWSPREASALAAAHYAVSFSGDPTRSTFAIQAVPRGGQLKDKCGTLTIDQAARKTAAASDCW